MGLVASASAAAAVGADMARGWRAAAAEGVRCGRCLGGVCHRGEASRGAGTWGGRGGGCRGSGLSCGMCRGGPLVVVEVAAAVAVVAPVVVAAVVVSVLDSGVGLFFSGAAGAAGVVGAGRCLATPWWEG